MEIRELEWREHNIEKLLAHEIDPDEVSDLVAQNNYTVDRRPEYPDQVRITGRTSTGRWITIAAEDLGDGVYRPVTGWNATRAELADHREKTQ
jgi:hypothetical protein